MSGTLNPWLNLPATQPFVLPEDAVFVEEFNEILGKSGKHFLDLRLPPNPFSGSHDAPLVVLLANPGIGESDLSVQLEPQNLQLLNAAIKKPGGSPFIWLTTEGNKLSPEQWWQSRTRDLKKIVGSFEELSKKLLVIELHGYHSKSWTAPLRNFPSQAYGFHLVEEAIARNAVIVAARCSDYWFSAIPGLRRYNNLVPQLKSTRSVHLSENNMEPGYFKMISQAIIS